MLTRHYFPHGIEGESMGCTFMEYTDIEKAIKRANRYSSGVYFASVDIEDEETRKIVYEIVGGDIYDYRENE